MRYCCYSIIVFLMFGLVTAYADKPEVNSNLERRIQSLIVDLADEKYETRTKAQSELFEIGRAAVPALQAASNDTNIERAGRIRAVLEDIGNAPRLKVDAAIAKGDGEALKKACKELFELPDCTLADTSKVHQFFYQTKKDAVGLALAVEAAIVCQKRIINTAPEKMFRVKNQFIPPNGRNGNGQNTTIIETLDFYGHGWRREWNVNDPDIANLIRSRQHALRRELVLSYHHLIRLYEYELHDEKNTERVCLEVLRMMPFFEMPLDQLIAKTWPVPKLKQEEALGVDFMPGVLGDMEILRMLNNMAETKEDARDYHGAIDLLARAYLFNIMAHDYRGYDYYEELNKHSYGKIWSLMLKLPVDKPLPNIPWINVLTPENSTIEFIFPDEVRENVDPRVPRLPNPGPLSSPPTSYSADSKNPYGTPSAPPSLPSNAPNGPTIPPVGAPADTYLRKKIDPKTHKEFNFGAAPGYKIESFEITVELEKSEGEAGFFQCYHYDPFPGGAPRRSISVGMKSLVTSGVYLRKKEAVAKTEEKFTGKAPHEKSLVYFEKSKNLKVYKAKVTAKLKKI